MSPSPSKSRLLKIINSNETDLEKTISPIPIKKITSIEPKDRELSGSRLNQLTPLNKRADRVL